MCLDERVLDCMDRGINPRYCLTTWWPAPFLSPTPVCVDWIAHPTRFGAAPRWVVVGVGEEVFDSGARQKVRLDQLVSQTERWTLADEQAGTQLWVRH